jgi:hypothetical protein
LTSFFIAYKNWKIPDPESSKSSGSGILLIIGTRWKNSGSVVFKIVRIRDLINHRCEMKKFRIRSLQNRQDPGSYKS